MLTIGIVGLPNVGKSSLFQAITRKQAEIQNYAFTTIEPNVGLVSVPDERLQKLAALSGSEKVVPATISFTDIAGLVKGAAQGEGLGNKFLSHVRETDLIVEVVRVFEDKNIDHVHGGLDPAHDISVINTELIMADMETVENRIAKTEKLLKGADKNAAKQLPVLSKFKETLDAGNVISSLSLNENEQAFAKELNLLTAKKFIYVFNISEEQLKTGWKPDETLQYAAHDRLTLSVKAELEISELEPEERKEFLSEFSLKESGLDTLARTAYNALDLITFFTTGEKETRAWTARRGMAIPRAARAIHSDFEEKFIKASVIPYDDLIAAGSYAAAREKGLLRTEGKEYTVREGDVVEIKI